MSRKTKNTRVSLNTALTTLRRRRFDPLSPDVPLAVRLSEIADLGVGSGRAWEMSVAQQLRAVGWQKLAGVSRYGVLGNWWVKA